MKNILIERNDNILRIAVIENKKLIECYMEEENNEPLPGQIYKGIVKNIIPAMKSAFVDIGFGKNCYMYLDKKFNNTSIKKNDEVIVEVLKEAIGEKGPKVTNAITIPGRYVVLETINKKVSFSKKIISENFKRLVKENVIKPEDIGLMIRTNAEKVSIDTLNKEINILYEIYLKILKEAAYSSKLKLLYNGEGVLDKILRDNVNEHIEEIIINNEKDYYYIENQIKLSPELKCNIRIHQEHMSLFNFYSVENQLLELRNNRVNLAGGGYIVINKTEAMYAIDVNTGKNVKSSSMDKIILDTNMEAASEIGRQIKLRNLSGIIIIDFIDMDNPSYKERILKEIKDSLEGDKGKSIVYPFTQLNLVQIARKRNGKLINEYIEEECCCCKGRGSKLRLSYLSTLIRNEIIKISRDLQADNIYIEMGSHYKDEIMKDVFNFAKRISGENKKIYINFVEQMELFKVEPLIFQNNIENMQKFKIYG